MEQFDTDDKLIENSKDKKEKKSSNSRYLLIAILCIVAICAIVLLIKVLKGQNPNSGVSNSKYKYIILFFINR